MVNNYFHQSKNKINTKNNTQKMTDGTRCQSYKQRYSPFEDKDNLFYSTVHRERNRDYKGVAEEIQ
jgi:hypothetical protein